MYLKMNPFRWIQDRLTVRLTLAMLFVSLGPLAVAGVIVLRLIEDSLRAQLKAQHEQLAAVSAANVYHYVDRAMSKLRHVSSVIPQRLDDPPSQETQQNIGRQHSKKQYEELTPQQMSSRLNQVLETNQEWMDLNYRNRLPSSGNAGAQARQGHLTPKQQQGVDSGQAAQAPQIEEQTYEGNDYIAPKVQRADDLVWCAIAIPLREGEDVFGSLGASLDFAPVEEMLKGIASEGRTITLLDGEGSVVVTSGAPTVGDLLRTEQPVGRHGWRIVVTEPKAAAFASLVRVRMQATAFIAGSGVVAFLLSLFLAARILRPVRRLTEAADAMREGKLGTRSGIERQDEIGRLAMSFDQMAARLQELDSLKSEFVAHVSHELRTPLTAMQLAVANLQEGVVGPIDTKQLEVLRRVNGDIERLITLVNEVLDIARIEAGKLELSRMPLDVAEVVRRAIESLRPLAEGKGVALECDVEASPMEGDRAKLHQVVTNLVDNAIKFTPSGGSVRVKVAAGVLSVSDTGPGIPPEQLAHIFDRFARAGATNAGAGLGLSIAKKIVELHGGQISVESEVGRGTTFTVSFNA